MEDTYFVILYCQNGRAAALMDETGDDLALFGSRCEASAAANNNLLGANFGFEIHEVGAGGQE